MNKKTYVVFYMVLFFFFLLVAGRIYVLNVLNHEKYVSLLQKKTEIYIEGESAPRGRILDRNGNVLVDNELLENIVYQKIDKPSFQKEIEIAKKLMSFFEVEEGSEDECREFYALSNPEIVASYITEEEKQLVQERKLTSSDLEFFKRARISKEILDAFTHEEKVLAHFYALMNTGYSYEPKVLKKEADTTLVANVIEANIEGISIMHSWKRVYPYGDLLRSIFGSVADGVPSERKEEYLEKGYSLTDTVGVSYLEEQYDSYLQGKKALYYVNADQSLTLVKEAKRGNDLYLSIDITLQQKLDEVVKATLFRVKKMPNTEYLKETYALIGNPETGEILAVTGNQLLDNGKSMRFQEVSSNVILSSFTSGSIVKGASHTVGYLHGAIDVGKKIYDSCVKLYLVPEKCSYKKLGSLDDISALKWSSNYYQFLTAIKMAGKTYSYNMKLDASSEVFDTYRSVFSMYGLGGKTGIDLPNEQIGVIGKTKSDDLLLNLSIGQYDTYTPAQLLQYINTIHTNGTRNALSFLKEIKSPDGEVLLENTPKVLSQVEMDVSYYERIKEGFYGVLHGGTGSGYINPDISAYGKTGTAESFYDSDNDGKVDVKTISSTLAMVGPSKKSQYSLVLVTPNLSHFNGVKDYTAPFNRYISTEMSEYMLSY